MSRSKGYSSLLEAYYIEQICIGFILMFTSMGLYLCRHHHCKCSFDACWVPISHPSPSYRLCEKKTSSPQAALTYDDARVLLWRRASHACRYSKSDTFADIYGMFGGFHYAKILPCCIGCYISGSGPGRCPALSKQRSSGSEHRKSLL